MAKFDLKKLKNPLPYGVKYISVSWTVLAWITSVTDRQTDREIAGVTLH